MPSLVPVAAGMTPSDTDEPIRALLSATSLRQKLLVAFRLGDADGDGDTGDTGDGNIDIAMSHPSDHDHDRSHCGW